MMKWANARSEVAYWAYRTGVCRYCLPCDVNHWGWLRRHRHCGCRRIAVAKLLPCPGHDEYSPDCPFCVVFNVSLRSEG